MTRPERRQERRVQPQGHRVRRVIACGILVAFLFAERSYYAPAEAGESPVLSGSPENMRLALAQAYRLRPDRRLLLAVSEIHHLLTGANRASADLELVRGGWQVRYADLDVGSLPEFPDFGDLINLLSQWVRFLEQQKPLYLPSGDPDPALKDIEASLDRVAAPHVIAALRQMDLRWKSGKRDATLLAAATRALVLLNLQALDRVEMTDQVSGKALALLALTKGVTASPAVREEALLAHLMGYSTHAAKLATSLPPTDAVGLYVTQDDQRLKAVAEASEATAEEHYLWVLRLAESRERDAWLGFRPVNLQQQEFVLPLVKAGLELHGFDTNHTYSSILPWAILRELARELGQPMPHRWQDTIVGWTRNLARRVGSSLRWIDDLLRWRFGVTMALLSRVAKHFEAIIADLVSGLLDPKVSELTNRFDTTLETVASKQTGPFLDPDTYRAYYRGYFYSALFVRGRHYLDALSSIPAARSFADQLGEPKSGPAADVQRWYRHLVQSKTGSVDPRLLLDDLAALPHFGAAPLERTFEALKDRLGYGDPLLLAAVRRLIARMDTRVDHRRQFADMAYTTLYDLRLAEALYRAILDGAAMTDPSLDAWFANLTGNTTRLRELLRSWSVKPQTRAEILGYLEKQPGVNAAGLRSEYRRLIDERPGDWTLRTKYVGFLERTRNYGEARTVIGEWLDTHGPNAGFDYIFARTALARIYYHEGQYEEGLAAVEPVVRSQQSGAMELAAMLLDKLDRRGDAEAMARAAVSRYPDLGRIRALLAELSWRHGKPREAAELLKSLDSQTWQFGVADRFAEVFKDRPKEEALAAFSALRDQQIDPFSLRRLAFPIAKAGDHELAFRMVSQLRYPGLGQLVFLVDAYSNLKAWQGQQAALDWLRKAIPPPMLNPASMIAFDQQQFELLWSLVENPQGEGGDFVWLMRAAAASRQSRGETPQRDALVAHFREPRAGHYHTLGRFLLGLETEAEVLALATTPKTRCEIAYYVGLRAETERRYADASDWYRVSVETGLVNNGEYRWAQDALSRWQGTGKSLSRLAAEKD